MLTLEINRLLSFKAPIRSLTNGTNSLQSRIKVVLKSFKSRVPVQSEASLSLHSDILQLNNQLRAPPVLLILARLYKA